MPQVVDFRFDAARRYPSAYANWLRRGPREHSYSVPALLQKETDPYPLLATAQPLGASGLILDFDGPVEVALGEEVTCQTAPAYHGQDAIPALAWGAAIWVSESRAALQLSAALFDRPEAGAGN